MPTRYLRPGIRDSEAIDAVSPMAECLFYRLIVTVDDFGRADARPAMVKANCFPVKEAITAAKCEALLAELARFSLISLYVAEGKPVLQMQKWDNVPRAKASKFPAPSGDCMHLHTSADNARTDLPGTGTGTGTVNREPVDAPRKRGATRAPADFTVTDEMLAWAKAETPLVDVKASTAKFLDHTFSKARTDWPATWRNWLRSDQERAEQKRGGQVTSFAEQKAEADRRRYLAFTGKLPPEQQAGDVIDMEPVQAALIGGSDA